MYRSATVLNAVRRSMGIALLLAATPSLIPSIAAAAEPPTLRVKVSDLDLASAQGQRTLEHRLKVAIDQVCAQAGSTSAPITAPRQIELCKENARASARHQLEERGVSPLLVTRR
jgi:UrcA family protein